MSDASFVWGPTYREMLDPTLLPPAIQQEARRASQSNELSPANLFNISWCDDCGRIRVIKLPQELTGVEANILVLIGKYFPSGSHKVGPAYSAIMEAEIDEQVTPGQVTLVSPSSGNFGIGAAYVARLKGYRALAVMPESASTERVERIRQYGAELELLPGGESDLPGILQQTYARYDGNPAYRVLRQFEMMANYRFHRYVTGRSALEASAGFGDGRVAAFVSAVGSGGTIGAGDEIKNRFPDAAVVAIEPMESPTLFSGGGGSHRVEGIGDQLVMLVHNVLNTDYVMLIHDEDCLQGLRAIQEGPEVLTRILGVPEGTASSLVGLLGVSSICNILGAIKAAKSLRIPAGRNIVTIATDGFDRYPSVMAGLQGPAGGPDLATLRMWAGRIFQGVSMQDVLDTHLPAEKERLFRQKEAAWSRFGYSTEQLQAMRSQTFWDEEYAKITNYDRRLQQMRGELG